MTVRIWDQTAQADGDITNVSLNGGTSAYSSGSILLQVEVSPVNDAPTVDLNGLAAGIDMVTPAIYGEGAPVQSVPIAGVAVTDPDSALLNGGVIILVDRPDGADEAIAVSTTGTGISAAWNPATWTITLSGSASAADYQQVLTTLTYVNASEDPDPALRSMTVVLGDGALFSLIATALVQVQAVNDPPAVAVNIPATVVLRGDIAIDEVGPPVVRLRYIDVDSPVLSIFYTISLPTGQGTLYRDIGTTSGVLDGGDDILIAGEIFTQAELLAGLVRYIHGGSGSSDGFAFTVSDGLTPSSLNVFQFTIDRSPPDIILDPSAQGAVNFTETDDDAPVRIASLATVDDEDSTDFDGGVLTITIQGGVATDEILGFDTSGAITIDGSNVRHLGTIFATLVSGGAAGQDVVLALNANADEPRTAAFIQAVTYRSLTQAPVAGARVVQAVMSDGDGDTSVPATRDINLIPVNDAPTISGGTIITPRGVAATVNLVVNDIDSYPLTLEVIASPGKGDLSGAVSSSVVSTQVNSPADATTFQYAPEADEIGTDGFTVRVTDALGATAQAVFAVVIIGGDDNRPWVVSDAPLEVEADSSLTYDIVVDFSDFVAPAQTPTLGEVSYSLVGSLPAGVTLISITADGSDATKALLIMAIDVGATGVIEAGIVVTETANNTTGYQPITIVIVPAGSLGG